MIYKVAGFTFGITTPENEPILESMTNLAPFVCKEAGDAHIFDLEIVPSMPEMAESLLFRSDDGPGFPEISIYTIDKGWLVKVRPLPQHDVASIVTINSDFTRAELFILDKKERNFALNNSLMLMYAFSTARLGALEMHSSVVMNEGRGYMFLGKSGTGKSTHSKLWIRNFPGTELLNDDNPILRLMPDGSARVFGSPWSGKTPCYKAKDVPVGAIVRIRQAPFNKIERLGAIQSYATLMSSASSFRPFSELAEGWHKTLEGLATSVPCYILDCLPDNEAAEVCHNVVSNG
ncbi:MAG: hypothetical protein IKZ60_04225 [Bacteroidales bacterium]|nr:hypothetical protein [Bacteroidales bacterium]